MHKRIIAVLTVAAVALPAAALTPRQKSDIAAITAIEHGMASAQDADTLSKSFDDNIVYYDIGNDSSFGVAAVKEKIGNQFKAVKNLRTKILDLNVYADGNVGYAFSTQNFLSDTTTGAKLDFIFRETDVFVKKGGQWRLTHQHLSVPVDLAAGKPLMESKMSVPPPKR